MASSAEETKKMRDAAKEAKENFQAISDILATNLATSRASADVMDRVKDNLKGQLSLEDQISTLESEKKKYLEEYLKTGQYINEDLVKRLDMSIDLLKKEKERKDLAEELKNSHKEIKDNLYDSLGPLGDMLKAGTALGASMALLKSITDGVGKALDTTLGYAFQLRHEMGLTSDAASQVVTETTLAAFSIDGMRFSQEELNSAASTYVDTYGTAKGLTSDLLTNVADLTKLTGDASSALRLNQIFDESGSSAKEVTESIKQLAEKEGVASSKVLRDMAGQMDKLVGASAEEIENFAKGNVELQKRGLSMSKLQSIAESMLDIEGSMKAQSKARVMLAGVLSEEQLAATNEIRQQSILLAQGQINQEEFAKAIEKSLISQEKFNELGFRGQQIYAQSIGQTVEGLTEQYAIITANNKVQQEANLTQQAFGKATEVWGRMPDSIKNATKGLIGFIAQYSLLNKMQGRGTGLSNLIPKFGKTGTGGGGAPKPEAPKVSAGGGKGMSSMTGAIEKIDAKKLLAGGAALVLVAASVFIFAKAVQEFTEVGWKEVGMAIVSMVALVGALALVGTIMSSGVGAVAILAGAAAMIVIAGAMYVLGKAIQEIATGFSMLGELGTQLTELVSIAPGMLLLAYSFGVLGASMIPLAAGLALITPFIGTLAVLGTMLPLINNSLNGGSNSNDTTSETKTDTMGELLSEIKGLRNDLQSQPILLTIDGKAVQKITRVQSRQSVTTRGFN